MCSTCVFSIFYCEESASVPGLVKQRVFLKANSVCLGWCVEPRMTKTTRQEKGFLQQLFTVVFRLLTIESFSE